jgi:hypothetical protein
MEPDAPGPDPDLLRRLTDALLSALGDGWSAAHAEWSQAGTQHSGRAYVTDAGGSRRIDVPDGVVAAFAALRVQMSTPVVGAWFSARIDVSTGAEPAFRANYERRPAWNSTTTSMLDHPDEPLVPAEDRWLADLQRHPRDRAHVPTWLAPDAVEGEAVTELREALDRNGVPRAAVALPGDPPGPVFEGVLEVVRYAPSHYALRVTDYGQHHLLGEFRSERQACLALWSYLTSPMPPAMRISRHELAQRSAAAQHSYVDLHARLRNVGPGGILTNLAAGVPYDRFGGVDGLYFFALGTPWEQRSLPPSANAPGATFVTFVALRPVEIQAEIVPPWFGQPGGGIRFHVEAGRAIRDLLREQVLAVIEVVDGGVGSPT